MHKYNVPKHARPYSPPLPHTHTSVTDTADLEQYVGRRQVGVHDVLGVQVGQGGRHVHSELEDVGLRGLHRERTQMHEWKRPGDYTSQGPK